MIELDGDNKNEKKTCQQSLIIYPKSWLVLWNYMIHACLFYGFLRDPQYLAFHISNKEGISNANTEDMDMTKEFVIDIILAINIVFKAFTTHMHEGAWENRLFFILKKYATSAEMYIDIIGCLPTMFTMNKANEQYPFKLVRFFYIVEVFDTISDFVRFLLLKLGLNKGNINKIQRLCLLFIICFQLIHVLGCIWIFIAKT